MPDDQILPAEAAQVASTALPVVQQTCSVHSWLELAGRNSPDIAGLLAEVAPLLRCDGVPVERVTIMLRTLHPRIAAQAYIWRGPEEGVKVYEAGHAMLSNEAFLNSPIQRIYQGWPGVRRRLADRSCPRDFPILADLDEAGMTDYLALPLPFSDGARYTVSFATRAEGGFTDAQLQRLSALAPTLALVVEVFSVRGISRNLMHTYLGRKTGERVLNGAIQRGSIEGMEAAIWYSDLRDFTALADRLPAAELLELLNDHFEHVVSAVHDQGGEVLKFMGDGTLAIFPIADFADAEAACCAAICAAGAALKRTEGHNNERNQNGQPTIEFGIALHLGWVDYGNVGAPDRLDFTVIGPAVNRAARIAGECRRLIKPVLTSAAFADAVPRRLAEIGTHRLKGVAEPQALHTLPEFAS